MVSGDVGEVEIDEFAVGLVVFEKPVLKHFGVARFDFLFGQRVEERGGNEHGVSLAESADFVLQTVEIYAGFAADGSVDSAEQRGWDVDESNASLKRSGSESAEVGNDTAADVDEQRIARCAAALQFEPHFLERVEVFVSVARRDYDDLRVEFAEVDFREHDL